MKQELPKPHSSSSIDFDSALNYQSNKLLNKKKIILESEERAEDQITTAQIQTQPIFYSIPINQAEINSSEFLKGRSPSTALKETDHYTSGERTIKKKRKGKSSDPVVVLNLDDLDLPKPELAESPNRDQIERSLEQHRQNLRKFEELRKSIEEDILLASGKISDLKSHRKSTENFKSTLRAEIKGELDEISPFSSKSSCKKSNILMEQAPLVNKLRRDRDLRKNASYS